MSLNGIKLITFDVTNTLLKFRSAPGRQYAEIGSKYGFIGTDATVKNEFMKNYTFMSEEYPNYGRRSNISWEYWWTEVVRKTFSKFIPDDGRIDEMAATLIEDYKKPKSWIVTEGTVDFLKYLRTNEYKLGVISNFDPRVSEILCNMGINEFFDFILSSYEAKHAKPDPVIFDQALVKSCMGSLKASESLHIGDNVLLDYMGARNAGWNSVVVSDQVIDRELQFVNPNHYFKDMTRLRKAIECDNLIL